MAKITEPSTKSPHLQQQYVSADGQEPIRYKGDTSWYRERSTYRMIKAKHIISDIAIRTSEINEQPIDAKEVLRGQKTEVVSSYRKLAEDLGEEQLTQEDFDTTLECSIKKWEGDGSLKYLQDWLEEHPKHKIYLSASPNKVIPFQRWQKAAEQFSEKERDESDEWLNLHWRFLSLYSGEELCGKSKLDGNGNALPLQLMVWTNEYNTVLPQGMSDHELLLEMQQYYGSASDQTLLQSLGHWYRLRESEDFGGVGALLDDYGNLMEPTHGIQSGANPKPDKVGNMRVPSAYLSDGALGAGGELVKNIENIETRFTIS